MMPVSQSQETAPRSRHAQYALVRAARRAPRDQTGVPKKTDQPPPASGLISFQEPEPAPDDRLIRIAFDHETKKWAFYESHAIDDRDEIDLDLDYRLPRWMPRQAARSAAWVRL